MQGLSRGRTPGLLREVAFSSWSLPLLITVSLISIVSCGDGAKNPDQEASANGTPVEQHSGPIVETKVDQGTSGRIDPEVSTKTPNSTQSDQDDTASQDPSAQPQGLPDLSLIEDPAFQRRAKLGHLVAKKRCILCHKIDGRGAILQPPLIQVSVRRLERMQSFSDHLETMRQDDPNRYEAKEELFLAIEDEADQLRKMSLWLHGYLKQPTFDNGQAKMPLQVLKPEEIDQLVSYVIQLSIDGIREGVKALE